MLFVIYYIDKKMKKSIEYKITVIFPRPLSYEGGGWGGGGEMATYESCPKRF
jgi:hypothetical protein